MSVSVPHGGMDVPDVHRPSPWRVAAWGALVVAIAAGSAFAPGVLVGAVALCTLAVSGAQLVAIEPATWRRLWFGTLAVAAFGPFLDTVTRQPVNWLLGSAVLVFPLLCAGEPVLRAAVGKRSRWPRVRMPIALGGATIAYTAYFFLQSLRPDVEPVSSLLSLRTPLIGLAAYFMTRYAFRERLSGEALGERVRTLLWLLVCLCIPVSLYAMFQFVAGLDRLIAWGLLDPAAAELALHQQRSLEGVVPIFRIFGTFRRSEQLGTFLFMCIVAGTSVWRLGNRPRWVILLSIGLAMATMLLALSLTNIINLILWLALIALLTRSRRLASAAVSLVSLIAVGGFFVNIWLSGIIGVRIAEHIIDSKEGTGRLQMSINWIHELADRDVPTRLFGSGICTGLDEYTLARIQSTLSSIGIAPGRIFACDWTREIHDNYYATHSLEIGVIGLALVWLLYVVIAVYTIPRIRQAWPEPYRAGFTILGAGVLALWPSGFVGALVVPMPMSIYFATLLAVLDVLSGRPPDSPRGGMSAELALPTAGPPPAASSAGIGDSWLGPDARPARG